MHQFPFRIRRFHSDNGSEFLNLRVAKLLHKLLIAEFTKSRAHRTGITARVRERFSSSPALPTTNHETNPISPNPSGIKLRRPIDQRQSRGR